MTKTSTTKKVTKKVAEPAYTVTLSMFGRKHTSQGATVTEALNNLQAQGLAKSKVILSVSDGKVTKDRVLMPFLVNKLLTLSPSMKQVAVKQISSLFNL